MEKLPESRQSRRTQCLLNVTGRCTPELLEVMTVCLRPHKIKATKIPAQDRVGAHEIPPSTEELLTRDGCGE